MDMNPGIICFDHCGNKIFCASVPEKCPSCEKHLDRHDEKLLPFRLPFPFVRANQYPRAVLVRPTHGDFLNDFKYLHLLHIGVTDSKGNIVDYGSYGLMGFDKERNVIEKRDNNDYEWEQCLLIVHVQETWAQFWDKKLMEIASQPEWASTQYHGEKHNCFSFVLAFLKSLNCGRLSRTAHDTLAFCQTYVVPRTSNAGKYISLFRRLKKTQYYIQTPSSEIKFYI